LFALKIVVLKDSLKNSGTAYLHHLNQQGFNSRPGEIVSSSNDLKQSVDAAGVGGKVLSGRIGAIEGVLQDHEKQQNCEY
jgi:hypothetical protein